MSVAPSVSYSITVRLEVPSHGRAVSELTHVVEQTGGEVTALDESAIHAQRRAVAADLVAHARSGTLPDAVRHARDRRGLREQDLGGQQTAEQAQEQACAAAGGRLAGARQAAANRP